MSAHVNGGRESSSQARSSMWVFVAAIVISGVACWIAVELAPATFRATAAWFLGAFALLLSVAVALAAYGHFRSHALRVDAEQARETAVAQVRAAREQAQADTAAQARQLDELRAAAEAEIQSARQESDAEAERIVDHVVPAVLDRLRSGASSPTALAEVEQPPSEWGRSVVRTVAEQVGHVERAKAAALAACANAAGRMQAQTTSMAADLREMENTADPDTLAQLLEVDHRNSQVGRLADSIAVLTGARSGRRWARPIAMESVLRGAMSRVSDYRRVQLHSPVEVAVVGYAAEGVIHLLAELIDNAAQFSPPTEQVHVYVEEAHAGVVVAIEDSGVGMMPRALAKAESALTAEAGDLSTVSGTRLGLAVVGQLARKHGLQVSFRPSARGGIGVVVMIPRQLITEEQRLNPTLPARRGELVASRNGGSGVAGRHSSAVATAEAEAEPSPGSADADEPFELARRQPGQALAASTGARPQPAQVPKSRTDPGAAFGAFQRARASAQAEHREAKDTDEPDSPQ